MPYSRTGFAKPQDQEAAMSTGVILLVLIGAIVAFGWTRLRGKMKLSVSGKNWIGPIVVVGLVLLMMWSSHRAGH
jgi:fumarate reductase subunit D